MSQFYWPQDKLAHDRACAEFYAARSPDAAYDRAIVVNKTWLRKVFGCALALSLVVLAVSCGQAKADTRIGVHVGSQHFGKGAEQFNNFNPGVYLYHDGWTAGTYYNSERKQSYYAGYTFEYKLGLLTAGVTVGAITGYARATVLPLVVPSLSVDTPLWGTAMRLSFVPKVGTGSAAVVHLSAEYRFN